MKHLIIVFSFLFVFTGEVAVCKEQLTPEQEKYMAWAKNLWDSLDKQHGKIKLLDGVASLDVPKGFYYLNPGDSEKVLAEVWGNPPGSATGLLGMLFPAEQTPFDKGSWAVTIGYEEDGYVKDEDADKIDYQDMLSQMKADTQEASKERIRKGYEAIELVGWAAEPFYDSNAHKLHWAKEIKFGDQPENTLNYNIRILGRKGVLVLNFIAGMDQKAMIDTKLNDVLALADFDQGSRYADFDPDIDKVAAYGIGALVAGKVIAKTGMLAAALIFLKKFGVLIFIAAAVFIKKLLKRKEATPAE